MRDHRTVTWAARRHERWRASRCLNLIPSENVTSPAVRRLLCSDLGHRYTAPDHFYSGARFLDEIEEEGEKLARVIFNAQWASLKPLSGHIAVMAVTGTFTSAGDSIVTISPADGGYPSISRGGIAARLGLRNLYFAYNRKRMNINVDRSEDIITSKKPKLVIFGASFILFPQPLERLSKAASEVDAEVVYDGSHVLGLIAGGEFQQPLQEGATILFGSTHKSFFGPQGGLIVSRDEEGTAIQKAIYPSYVDNAHWNRIAALTLALEETRAFGKGYAAQVVRNSKALARALDDSKIRVLCGDLGYTESHQVLLGETPFGEGELQAAALEKANIIVDRGVRLGTCEVTRRGMREPEMERIADLIVDVLHQRRSARLVKREVSSLAKEFRKVQYCFQDP